MTEYVKKSDVLELLSLPKDLIAEYVCDLKGLWIDDDEAEQTEPKYDAEEVAKDINRRIDIGHRLETMSCQECKYWKYIAKEWQCSVEKCQYEPQTDCAWK